MEDRKKIIEEIMANINAMKNKMQFKAISQDSKDRITHSQWFALSIIESHKDIGIKEISNMLCTSPSAASQLVDGLMASGYVMQKPAAKDRRFLQINLSTKGQKIILSTRKKHLEVMEKIFNALTDQELNTYLALHKKILNKIQHEN